MKSTTKFKFNHINKTYEEDSRPWHVMQDIKEVLKGDYTFTIKDMMNLFGTDLEYYESSMGELIADNMVDYL